jgi:hypothetical protein
VSGESASPAGRLVHWAWVAWAAAILFLSAVPPGWILEAVPRTGWSLAATAGHVAEFGLFTLLVWLALPAIGSVPRRAVVSGAVSLAFGLVIELVQWPIPYRSFDLLDWAADAAGTAAVLLVLSACRYRRAAPPARH